MCATATSPQPIPAMACWCRPVSPPQPDHANSISDTHEGHSMTTIQNKPINPVDHLSAGDIENLGKDLDAIRQQVLDTRGERDATYIRRIITAQRTLEASSRLVLLFSLFPPAWLAGTAGLSVGKILENMEIGHNVLHGQWDWMRDPKIHSTTWEWDNASPAEQWKHAHNEEHHTYTNVIGKDGDLGYGIMRVDEEQPWHPFHLGQPLWNLINAFLFQYGIAAYDLKLGKNLKSKERRNNPEFRARVKATLRKVRTQATRDYIVRPLLSGPSAPPTLAANLTANVARNLWTHSVIMCGHFPEGVETFAYDSIDGETRGQWYLRQMIGSANVSGTRFMHLMTGNLSFQIAPQVRAIFEKYGLTYTSGPLVRQVASAWAKVIRLSLPSDGKTGSAGAA